MDMDMDLDDIFGYMDMDLDLHTWKVDYQKYAIIG